MSVVLPAPLGPTSPIRSPARTSKASSEKIGSPLYWRPSPEAEMRIMELRLFAQGSFLPEQMMIMLGEAVCLIADVLEQPKSERTAPQDERPSGSLEVDLLLSLGQCQDRRRHD